MKAVKKTSTSPNADRELDDETFMSAEELRNYMNATMVAKASKEIDVMDRAGDAKRALIIYSALFAGSYAPGEG